ncbi:MAG: YjbE family putative metal transport protein [Burkholderiaceae bacterium]
MAGTTRSSSRFACRNLPPELRTRGIVLGTAGAIVLRVILIFFAVSLLLLPSLKIVGGLLLIWIGVKLLIPQEGEGHGELGGGNTLWAAVRTVIIADLVMSIDNVIGIAAAAQKADPDHQFGLVVRPVGQHPDHRLGQRFVIHLIERYPLVVWMGGALLGWIAGGMIVTDTMLQG